VFVDRKLSNQEGTMHLSDHERMAAVAKKKAAFLETSPGGYLILSAMAGIYLGFGIALIFSLGGPLAAAGSPEMKLVMGASFGIALTLVIFAGSELFTGNNLVGVIGGLSRSVSWGQVLQLNVWSWLGNLIGSLALAWLVVESGVFAKGPTAELIQKVAGVKMALGPWELFVRGILCNWLICLAVWTAGRTTSDAAKIMLIFWCLFAFIGIGFEHSIANQSFLGMALFMPHADAVSWAGFWYNQLFVVLGNIVGGGLFVGGLYWIVSPYRVQEAEPGEAPQAAVAQVVRA
jgi:nitrite transporter